MNSKIYYFLELQFPKDNLQEWENSEVDSEEFEWDDRLAYMLSDRELSTVNDFLTELGNLKESGKIFSALEYSQNGQAIHLKGYMDFDTLSMYFVGLITIFRKALTFKAEGKAAFISSFGVEPLIMWGLQITQNDMHTYICDGANPNNPEFINFCKIWNDGIAQAIESRANQVG